MGTRTAKLSIEVDIKGQIQNLLGTGKGTAQMRHDRKKILELLNGTTENKADRVWYDEARSLSVGTEDIDVYDFAAQNIGAGAGADALGQTLTLAEITLIAIFNNDADGFLHIGGKSATTAWNSLFNGDDDAVLVIPPGGFAIIACPDDPAYAVADTTNHLLQIEAVTADVDDWDIYIAGRSA